MSSRPVSWGIVAPVEIVVDVVLVVLAVLAIAAGWSKGAIRSAGTLIGLGLGLWLGLMLAPVVVGWFAGAGFGGVTQRSIVAAVVILVCAGVVYALVGALAGIALGAASGYSSLFRTLVDPTLQGLRAIPSLAWVPLFILWFGIFEQSKIILIAVGVFFPVYLGVSSAIRSVDRKIVEVGQVFRLKGLQLVRRILLPAILPQVVTALRVGLGLGWMFVVAAEIMGASEGLGYLIVYGRQLFQLDLVMASVVVVGVVGFAINRLLDALEKRLRRGTPSAFRG